MRLTLLLMVVLMSIAIGSAEDGYYSMHGNTWSTHGSYGASVGSYYPDYAFWPYYPAIPAKFEVLAAKERLSYSKYSNWWQVQATKERLSALRYANKYYYDYYDVPMFTRNIYLDRSYDRYYGSRPYDDDRHRSVIGEDRERGWTDDSPEDVHIPIADEIRMELEREGVISSSE